VTDLVTKRDLRKRIIRNSQARGKWPHHAGTVNYKDLRARRRAPAKGGQERLGPVEMQRRETRTGYLPTRGVRFTEPQGSPSA
jgi:hypothetical protein